MCSSTKYPYPPHGRSLEIPREREVLKTNFLEAMYENKLEFRGGRGGAKQKTLHGGSMDLFLNCTLYENSNVDMYQLSHVQIYLQPATGQCSTVYVIILTPLKE